MLPKVLRMHLAYTIWSLVLVEWVPHSKQQKILHLGSATDPLIPHLSYQVLPKAPRMHLAYTFWSLVSVEWVPHFN